jgi:uncharacterized membrane protein
MRESRFQTVIYIIAALVALGGLVEATYLTVLALTGGTAVCGGSSDCFKVLGSPYARPGGIPVAAVGMLAYFAVFSFVTFAAFGSVRAHALFAATVAVMFLTTLWLLFVQAFLLHAFCRYCLMSAAAIFFLSGLVIASPAPFRWRNGAHSGP